MLTASYDNFFSSAKVISMLCKQRVALATWRRDQAFFSRITNVPSAHSTRPNNEQALASIFPSRKEWHRPPAHLRKTRSSGEVLFLSLYHTVMHKWNSSNHAGPEWLVRLEHFVGQVQKRALSNEGQWLDSPIIRGRRKDGNYYRPIAQFGLIDSLIERLAAQYIRYCFDPDLLNCAMAFRVSRTGGEAPRHHDAIRAILAYHSQSISQSKWVAECDICSFYDCVDHGVARHAISLAVERAKQRSVAVDTRALRLLDSYLCAYSFSHNVKGEGLAQLREKTKNPNANFKWPTKSLMDLDRLDPFQRPVGIPQGGALSCLLANLVLDSADRAVYKYDDDKLLYLRYCDDMILIHTKKSKCESGFQRYLEALDALKLPYHPADKFVGSYGRAFWSRREEKTGQLEKRKTKSPYRWGRPDQPENVPWLSFVGYQLHFFGHIRVRPESLAKELGKQEKLTNRVVSSINQAIHSPTPGHKVKVSPSSVVLRIQHRLVSMAVGKRHVDSDLTSLERECWVAGFSLLTELPHPRYQLRMLDRSRERQLNRVRRVLHSIAAQMPGRAKGKLLKRLMYLGRPFSYRGQFPKNLEID